MGEAETEAAAWARKAGYCVTKPFLAWRWVGQGEEREGGREEEGERGGVGGRELKTRANKSAPVTDSHNDDPFHSHSSFFPWLAPTSPLTCGEIGSSFT